MLSLNEGEYTLEELMTFGALVAQVQNVEEGAQPLFYVYFIKSEGKVILLEKPRAGELPKYVILQSLLPGTWRFVAAGEWPSETCRFTAFDPAKLFVE